MTLVVPGWLIAVVVVALPFGGLALRTWVVRLIQAGVDSRFALNLESHKHELNRVLEQDKFDLQRRLAAGNLYMQKQHEAAAEAYDAIRRAHGDVSRLKATQDSHILADCNRADLIGLFEKFDVHGGKRDSLLAEFEADPAKGFASAERHLWSLRFPIAQEALRKARNRALVAELYFSAETRQAFQAFHAECSAWLIDFEMSRGQRDPDARERQEQLDSALEQVQLALRAELTDPTRVLGVLPTPAAASPLPTRRRWWHLQS
jgi:hypothetical protein